MLRLGILDAPCGKVLISEIITSGIRVTKKEASGQSFIRGMIFPAAWDEKGDTLQVVIDSPDEKQYIVELDEKGKELIALVRREVEVNGLVRRDGTGKTYIHVQSYRLVG